MSPLGAPEESSEPERGARDFAIVVAADDARGIGTAGTLPWRLPADMAFFRKLTSEAAPSRQNAVIMGRKTFESIPAKFRPLPGRLNIVISRGTPELPAGVLSAHSLDEALIACAQHGDVARIFVIGGAQIYALALGHPRCSQVLLTRIRQRFACDTFLPELGERFRLAAESDVQRDGAVTFTFQTYERSGAAAGETPWV